MNSKNKKEEHFNFISESLRALAHPERLKILMVIYKNKSNGISVSELHGQLGLTQPVTSRHLSILKNKDILTSRKEGSNVYYSINKKSAGIFHLVKCLYVILEK